MNIIRLTVKAVGLVYIIKFCGRKSKKYLEEDSNGKNNQVDFLAV